MSLWSRIERRLSDFADEILPDEFRIQVTSARDLLTAGQAREAAEMLEAMVEERPEHPGALSLLGAARLDLGDAKGALEAFGRALHKRDDMPEAWLGAGEAEYALGNPRSAIDAFRTAVNQAGGERGILAVGYRGLGLAYRAVGDLDKAIRELRKAVAEDADDPIARAGLGEVLLSDPRISADEARRHLDLAMRSGQAPALAFLALGRIALDEADGETAKEYFGQALALTESVSGGLAKQQTAQALVGLGDAALALGETQSAHRDYLRALDLQPRSAAVHARIGDVHRQVANPGAALQSYQRSLAIASDNAVLRRALDTALEVGEISTAVRMANDLLVMDPTDTRAMVARGIALVRSGERDAARATFRAALAQREDVEAHLAFGQLELEDDVGRAAGGRAAAHALAALRVDPTSERARALLAEARARELGDSLETETESETETDSESETESETDSESETETESESEPEPEPESDASELYALAENLRRLALVRTELGDLAGEAAQAAADFDQPLLVTVMGEFSSGKSTFVNAFIGDDVAPTGITPTTATINVVKYGRERGGRIVYRDGRVETIAWDDLFTVLRAFAPARARQVEVVEILLPLIQLERVNIVDTPGLNSILPEHEEVARGFIARADAVVWLFTATQAGKASERKALQRIREEGKRVLGVLNKTDQLAPSDVEQLVAHVQGELGDIVELVVPISARRALEAQSSREQAGENADEQEDQQAGDGNWPALHRALEQRFFARSRELKRVALGYKLESALHRARAIVHAERDRAIDTASGLRADAERVLDAGVDFIDDVVVTQRRVLADTAEDLYRRAAREVLDLVRPRQLPFGSHSATPADRDYLLSLLESGYEAALAHSRREVIAVLGTHGQTAVHAVARVSEALGNQAVSDITRTADDALRLIQAQVFDRTLAYLRGYLRGGYIADFFRRELPKLELAEEATYQALVRNAPDLDAEIAIRLARAGSGVLESLAARLEHWAGVAEIAAYDIEVGVSRALDHLEIRRREATPE